MWVFISSVSKDFETLKTGTLVSCRLFGCARCVETLSSDVRLHKMQILWTAIEDSLKLFTERSISIIHVRCTLETYMLTTKNKVLLEWSLKLTCSLQPYQIHCPCHHQCTYGFQVTLYFYLFAIYVIHHHWHTCFKNKNHNKNNTGSI